MTTRTKGAVLLARKSFVTDVYGEAAWQQVLDALPAEDRALLSGVVLTSGWYPFAVNERLDREIVDKLGQGDAAVLEKIGERSAKANLSGPHRGFLTPGDPQRFMSMTDRIYSFYYDTGRREYESTGPNSGVITTWEADTFSATDCRTVIGWYRQALEMCGARNVVIDHDLCRGDGADRCRYKVSWQG